MTNEMNQPSAPATRIAWVVALSLLTLSAVGCEVIAWAAHGVTPTTVKAKYTLQDRPTAVLVDDVSNNTGDQYLQRQLASEVGYNLQKNTDVTTIVSQRKIDLLQNELGRKFAQTPIDDIGRQVGAEQVIYIDIKSVQYAAEPGMIRPTALVEVKVVDATTGDRLFPPSGNDIDKIDPNAIPTEGYPVAVTMFYRTQENPGEAHMVATVLAERIGRDVARLFHKYKPREPGQPFE